MEYTFNVTSNLSLIQPHVSNRLHISKRESVINSSSYRCLFGISLFFLYCSQPFLASYSVQRSFLTTLFFEFWFKSLKKKKKTQPFPTGFYLWFVCDFFSFFCIRISGYHTNSTKDCDVYINLSMSRMSVWILFVWHGVYL